MEVNLSEDLLRELYWDEGLSAPDIGRVFSVPAHTIYYKMSKFCVPRRTGSESHSGQRNHNYGKPRTQETRIKIGEGNRGDKIQVDDALLRKLYLDERLFIREIGERFGCSKATILRRLDKGEIPVREPIKGEKHPSFGKCLSKEHREKIRVANTGKKQPEEALKKMRAYQRSEKSRKYLSEINSGENHPQYGTHQSEEHRRKIGEAQIGEKNHAWRGGVSFEPYPPEFNEVLKRVIRERDNHTCQIHTCGKQGDRVHHIDYNKENNEAENLITLCGSHHSKTNFNREEWIGYFNNLRVVH